MLVKRILTALIGIPIAVLVINYGGLPFIASIILLAAIAWHEYFLMMRQKKLNISYKLGLLAIFLLLGCAAWGNSQESLFVLLLFTFTVFIKAVLFQTVFSLNDAAYTALGVLYIGMTFSYLILLRSVHELTFLQTYLGSLSLGAVYLWLPFIGTWASDTFAYFVGSKFGQHKLCPTVSPGKTVEGALGGLAGSVVGLLIVSYLFKITLIHGIIIGVLVGIAAPLGDLTESAIKRYTGVKDSGSLLPGHGGVLDRFDSIMFAVPVVYYYVYNFIIS